MIDVAFTPEEVVQKPLVGASVVVIDVVRASTTIVTALAHGARTVVPVATPQEAMARAQVWPDGRALLGGERGGAPPPGFECGNSPTEYAAGRVRGRAVIFTTTNGTRALLAVEGAKRVAVAGFVNAAAVIRWLARQRSDVVLVCAGESGRFCLEDASCAGLLVERLRMARPGALVSDAARAAGILYAHYRSDLGRMLDEAVWAQMLVSQGRGSDLPLCAAVDAYDVVPVLEGGALVLAARD
ncbi:MAG: 2-phosphosulfolactate phosphatase [Candidatus Rokuibacteriota bacterium]